MSEYLRSGGGVVLPDSVKKAEFAAPYLEAFTAVSKILESEPGSKLANLFSWFPTPERHEALINAPDDLKAEQVASFLGHTVDLFDRTQYLHIYRPQDRSDHGTAATDLGLERDEAAIIQPIAMAAAHDIESYTDYVIDTLLQGNLALVAAKITTAGQAIGFHIRIVGEVNAGKRADAEKLKLTFTDGSETIDDHLDAVLYIDDLPRDTRVEMAQYDPQTDSFELRFATNLL